MLLLDIKKCHLLGSKREPENATFFQVNAKHDTSQSAARPNAVDFQSLVLPDVRRIVKCQNELKWKWPDEHQQNVQKSEEEIDEK